MKPTKDVLEMLYITDRKTTYAIGAIFGVNRVSVIRWLKSFGIALRPSGSGLANRGLVQPTACELYCLIHEQFLTYQEVASIYGVDFTTVPHWLDKHGIPRSNGWVSRNKQPAQGIDVDAVSTALNDGQSMTSIASRLGVSRWRLAETCRSFGIKTRASGFKNGARHYTATGIEVKSVYEVRAANWLIENHVPFVYEPRLPRNRRFQADFLANGWYIEIWGVTGSEAYTSRQKRKRSVYAAMQCSLIELYPRQFSQETYKKRLKRCLSEPSNQGLLPYSFGQD